MCPVYVSKIYSNCEKQIISLLIPKKQGRHYLAFEKIICIITWNNLRKIFVV